MAAANCIAEALALSCRYPRTRLWLRAIVLSIDQNSFKSTTLLQLTFAPFGVLASIFATMTMSFWPFALACCISRLKIINYVSGTRVA